MKMTIWRKTLSVALVLAALFLVPAKGAFAETVQETAVRYAELPTYDQLQLSPNGGFVAYLTPHDGRKVLMIQHRTGGSQVAVPFHKNADIDWFRWASDSYLLIGYSQTQIDRRYVRSKTEKYMLAAIRRDGNNFRMLKQNGYAYYDLLPDDPNHIIAPMEEDVAEIDLATGDYKIIQHTLMDIFAWQLDQQREVRFGMAWQNDARVPYYRTAGGDWISVAHHAWWNDGFGILGFLDNPRLAYGRGPSQHGTLGLFKIDMQTGMVMEEIFADPKVDIDDLILAPFSRRAVGVSFIRDRREAFYWDSYYGKFQAFIDRMLPDTTNIIVGKAQHKKVYLILAKSDREAGVYFHFDLAAKKLSQIAARHPNLDPATMAPVKPVVFQARDGQEIPGYLTVPFGKDAKNLPLVVMPHGGPRARTDADYDYIVQAMAARGYAVYQPNFRGSRGYGRAFLAAGYNEWGGLMQRDVTDATQWLISEGIADPNRVCILGLSYGGYSALIGAAQNPDLYACAVSGNGVADLPFFMGDKKYGYVAGDEWAEDMQPKDADAKTVSPKHLADSFKTPVLLIHAKDDARVNINQSNRMYDALRSAKKDVRFVKIDKGTHWLVNEEARQTFLEASLSFLEEHLSAVD